MLWGHRGFVRQHHAAPGTTVYTDEARAYQGIFHKISPKHLDRYVTEFAGRHNMRTLDTVDMMVNMVVGMVGKRLRYRELVG